MGIDVPNPTQGVAAAMRTEHRRGWGRLRESLSLSLGLGAMRAAALENGASAGDVAGAAVVGQNAVMADADQARGQNVPAETADKFVSVFSLTGCSDADGL